MALLHIRLWPDPILKIPTKLVDRDEIGTDVFNKFLDDMHETMVLEDGVGLAAPQIGVSQQVAVMTRGGRSWDLINPHIVDTMRQADIKDEGCLSLEGMNFKNVARSTNVRLLYTDRKGEKHTEEFEGFMARAVQHEIDHLAGRLLIDRLLLQMGPKKAQEKAQEFEERIQAAYAEKVKRRYDPVKDELARQRALSPGARTALIAGALLGSNRH